MIQASCRSGLWATVWLEWEFAPVPRARIRSARRRAATTSRAEEPTFLPSLSEILQKIWAGLPGLLGLFLFLVTLGIFIAISVWEQSTRRSEALRAERERAREAASPPVSPEPVGAGRDHARKGS